jgi:hypothetical protein
MGTHAQRVALPAHVDKWSRMRTEPSFRANQPRAHGLQKLRSDHPQLQSIAAFGLFALLGCERSLDGAHCPCTEGWTCCQAENVCVRDSSQCSSSADGGYVGGAPANAGSGGSANGGVGGAPSATGGVLGSTGGSTIAGVGGRGAANSIGGDSQARSSTAIPCVRDYGYGCGACGGRVTCDGSCSVPSPDNLGFSCNSCGDVIQCDGSCPVVACQDQSFNAQSTSYGQINELSRWVGQTYTAAKTGRLVGVAVDVGSNNIGYPLLVAVYDADGGLPIATLVEVALPTNSSPLENIVSFANTVLQTTGHQYAIGVSYPDAPAAGAHQSQGYWSGCSSAVYAGREVILSNDGIDWQFAHNSDELHFATYVMPE